METIYKQENELFAQWQEQYVKDGISDFCYDGLIFNGEIINNGYNSKTGNQEEVLKNTKRRVLFFMKEPNGNADEDYREWNLTGYSSSIFFKFIYSWLNGLCFIKAGSTYPELRNERNLNLPLIIVNAKKQAGTAVANNNVVYDFAFKYKSYLRAQFDIYSPNIIVCGGGPINGKQEVMMLSIVKDLIYDDIEFTQMECSDWIWYNVEQKIVLINSNHPSAIKSDESKYNWIMEAFQTFLNNNIFPI